MAIEGLNENKNFGKYEMYQKPKQPDSARTSFQSTNHEILPFAVINRPFTPSDLVRDWPQLLPCEVSWGKGKSQFRLISPGRVSRLMGSPGVKIGSAPKLEKWGFSHPGKLRTKVTSLR